jgi:hypothetical protein
MQRIIRITIGTLAALLGSVLWAALPAGANPTRVTFTATCGGTTMTWETGVNASPLLTVVTTTPRMNAVIEAETVIAPTGTVFYSKTLTNGFLHNGLTTVPCTISTTNGPYAGFVFYVTVLFTPVGT